MTPNAKIISGLLVAVGAAVVFALISFEPSPKTAEDQSEDPMRIATYYWPGMYWIDIARSKGWFAEAGLEVTFTDANPDYYGAVADVRQGRLDTMAVWLFDLMQMSEKGAELAMVLATDESRGSEALVGSHDVETIGELKGKSIGVPSDTTLVYVLHVMLSRFGLGLGDITLVDMEAEQAANQLAAGEVDAVMTWEPYATAALEYGNRLYDTARIPGLIRAGMIFRKPFINERPEDIERMIEVWWRATEYIQSRPQDAFAIVAEAQNVSPEDVESFAEINQIMDLRDNVEVFTYASGLESLFGSARKIQRFLSARNGGDGAARNFEEVLEGRFVRHLFREENLQ